MADLEQYTRMNDVIVSGLKIKPRSYARAVTTDHVREPDGSVADSVEQQVSAFLQPKGIELDCNAIEACHPLPRRNNSDKPAIQKHKTAVLKQGRKLKGTDVYMNEHLTRRIADIAWKARSLKKQKKIQSTYSTNCKISIKLNGTPEEAKVMVIKDITELDKFQ